MALITRANAAAAIPVEETQKIWQETEKQSLAMRTFAKVNMKAYQQRLRLADALPGGGFVGNSGDGGPISSGSLQGLKPTTTMSWKNKVMQAEEIATIVAIPENVLNDADIDIFAEVRAKVAQEFGRILDAAVFFGVGSPWSESLASHAIASGNVISRAQTEGRYIAGATAVVSTNVITTASAHGLVVGNAVSFSGGGSVTGFTAGQVYYVLTAPSSTTLTISATPGGSVVNLGGSDGSMGGAYQRGVRGIAVTAGLDLGNTITEAMSLVENDGYDPDTLWAGRKLNQDFRQVRDANGQLLYVPGQSAGGVNEDGRVWSLGTYVSRNTAFAPATAGNVQAIVGQRDHAVLGIREDMDVKLLTESTLVNSDGTVMLALAQQDMVALRFRARYGFVIADPTTLEGGSSASPFSVITG